MQRSEICFNTKREISYFQEVMYCSLHYINASEIPNHFTLIYIFWFRKARFIM